MNRRPTPRHTKWMKALSRFGLCFAALNAFAHQTTPDPTLQKRSAQTSIPKAATPTGISTLPPEASGEYLLDELGSVIEITLDQGKLSGYVTKMGDEQSDKDTPLTYFFEQTSAQADTLSFTTKKVHGVSYSFAGAILRGDQKTTRDQEGYYRLKGTWIIHDDSRSTQPRPEEISLKSTPRKR